MKLPAVLAFACLIALSLSLSTMAAAPAEDDSRLGVVRAAQQAAVAVLQKGPVALPLAAGQATLSLPEGYGFVPAAESAQWLRALGNQPDEGLQGLVLPLEEGRSGWLMVVTYADSGYIRDEEAKTWNADELLSSIRSSTEELNESRRAMGIPELDVAGWAEPPSYDPAGHRLVWSIATRIKDQPDVPNGVNYNTLALGREGYMSMNLVTDAAALESLKPVAQSLLAALEFNVGKRYADFEAGKDKVAEYGLAALVAGVAAKKLGLFALAAGLVAKFGKIIFLVALGGFGALKSLWTRKKGKGDVTEAA